MELSDNDIDRFFRGCPLYGGCLSRNQMQKVKAGSRQFYIINLDPSSGPGTHWTLLSFMDHHIGVYMDPFGEPPPESVERLMKRMRAKNVYNNSDVQSLSSVLCGYYCAFVACKLLDGKSFASIMKSFSPQTSLNEQKMKQFAHQAFSWKNP